MQFQSSFLKTNARMHLYDTPRDTMAKNSMLRSLCSTSTWKAPRIMPNTSNYLLMCSRASCSTHIVITHVLQSSLLNINHQSLKCSRASRSTQIINHSNPPKLPSQHKSSINQVLQSFPLNTKYLINHVLQIPCPT